MIDPPDNFGFRLINCKYLVLQPVSVGSIAIHILAEFHTLDDGKALVLRDGLRFLLRYGSEGV